MGYYSGDSDAHPIFYIVGGIIIISSLAIGVTKCNAKLNSNRDIIDTEKEFNFAIDYAKTGISVVKIDNYTDYQGITVEYTTQDGLQILTGLNNVELVKTDSFEKAYKIALELSGGEETYVTSYDKNMDLDTTVTNGEWNKEWYNFNYDFDYAITETEAGVIVTKISSWKDWEEDDKVQFTDMQGNVYLGTYDNVKLLNARSASNDSVYQYALSLAGSEDRLFGDINKGVSRTNK